MTEKRYELIWETDEMCNVFDNDLDVNSTLSVEEVVDLLNSLNDENEQLKQRVEQLERNIEKYIDVKYRKFVDGEVGGWSNDELQKVKEENEQLKKDCSILVQSNQEYRKENEELKWTFGKK